MLSASLAGCADEEARAATAARFGVELTDE